MNIRIVYMFEGSASILAPADNRGTDFKKIGEQDVPQGLPFAIVDVSAIPEDRTYRSAWIVDLLNDGVGQRVQE